jgi:5-carboxymethyl-2-hydroxymuconate isomerase
MPHLAIQHSANVAPQRMQLLCDVLHATLVATALFPLGGIRVRAISCAAATIADQHPDNAFVDMIYRIGTGRSVDDRIATGKKLMTTAEAFFAAELARPHFALSLEIIEIDPVLSWKTNTIHERLKGKA